MSVTMIGDSELKSDYAAVAIESTFPYETVRVTVKDDGSGTILFAVDA
jgi:hypothetical protein